MRALAQARTAAKRIRRVVSTASLSGWSMVIFGGLTMACFVFGGLSSIVIGGVLVAIGANELRGGALVRRFDPRGARVLGWNQIVLGVLIVAYAGWKLLNTTKGSPLDAHGGSTGYASIDDMIVTMSSTITVALYVIVAGVGIVVPGLTSLYYFSRGRTIREYVERTPPWIVETLRTAG